MLQLLQFQALVESVLFLCTTCGMGAPRPALTSLAHSDLTSSHHSCTRPVSALDTVTAYGFRVW